MAGIDTDIEGEARPQKGLKVGYLPQEPVLDEEKKRFVKSLKKPSPMLKMH